jgi:uncharacterized protein (DUF1800 family)
MLRIEPGFRAACVLALAALQTTVNGSASPPENDRTIVHVLNRVAFGPGPGDVERVRAMGVRAYIDRQLHPEGIPDADVDARLKGLTTLRLTSAEIAARYEAPLAAVRRDQRAAGRPGSDQAGPPPEAPRMTAERQEANLPLLELSAQKIVRATYSDRQLQEVLTDFWFNHFNVDARKGPERFLLTSYERDAIRPHVLGRFRDLLDATARSPAMLFYLDNWMSADPGGPHPAPAPRGGGRAGPRPFLLPPRALPPQRPYAPHGLNENYGRELLELHTLGVDGGYTQTDVTEVARAFTGWSIANPRAGGSFRFAAQMHDEGDKVVLGRRISGGGLRDGEEVLDLVASHPATARFIASKLVRRFVSDNPPPPLVDRAAATFLKSGGDLRAVMTTILTSPEFLSPDAFSVKVKSPFEFIVSALRATGADVDDARPLVRLLQQLGMPLYQCQPPTGYRDAGETWMNAGALVNRMNDALALANGRLNGVRIAKTTSPLSVLPGPMSDTTRRTIEQAAIPAQALALALGSPEFQRR